MERVSSKFSADVDLKRQNIILISPSFTKIIILIFLSFTFIIVFIFLLKDYAYKIDIFILGKKKRIPGNITVKLYYKTKII